MTQLIFADIGLSPRHIGDGVVHLGSTEEHTVDTSRAPSLTVVGQPSGVEDGDTFTVDDGRQIVTFEFDRDGKPTDSDDDAIHSLDLMPARGPQKSNSGKSPSSCCSSRCRSCGSL